MPSAWTSTRSNNPGQPGSEVGPKSDLPVGLGQLLGQLLGQFWVKTGLNRVRIRSKHTIRVNSGSILGQLIV